MTDSRHAIENLIYEYAERMDLGDFDGVAALLADAGYGPAGGPMVRGADEIRDLLVSAVRLYDGTPRTKHVTTNLLVEIDEDGGTALSRSYFTVLQSLERGELQVIVAGRYHDRFVRTDGEWRFAERAMHMDLVGDLGGHLYFDPDR